MAARGWICTNKSAKEILSRVSIEQLLLLLLSLNKVPLHPGNVVEDHRPFLLCENLDLERFLL